MATVLAATVANRWFVQRRGLVLGVLTASSATGQLIFLPVLAWQVRTLIQVRDMLDHRVSEGRMAEKSGLSDFVVRKSIGQARQFTMSKLLDIHHNLLELDHAVKTGRADAEMSLDALVVEMCR